MKWFRFYSDAANDPKVRLCSDYAFKTWVCTLCIASLNDGELPPIDELCYRLRLRLDRGRRVINELIERGLIDKTDKGLTPHNWHGRQFQSDDVNVRVKRYRAKKGNAMDAPIETLHETLETQTQIQKQTQIQTQNGRDWDRFAEEYPGEVIPDRDAHAFFSVIETEADEALLFGNLPDWCASRKFREGYAPAARKFLMDGHWKVKPKPDVKSSDSIVEQLCRQTKTL